MCLCGALNMENTETLQRVVYRLPSGWYVRSGGTSTKDIGQAEVFFKDSKKWKERWARYGYEQVPVIVSAQ